MPKGIGGSNLLEIFTLVSDDGVLTPGTKLLSNNQITSTNITGHPTSKNVKFDIDSDLHSKALEQIFAQYLVTQSSPEVGMYEDSSPSTVNVGNYEKLLLFVSYGTKSTDDNDIMTLVTIGQVEGGDMKTEANKNIRRKFTVTGLSAEFETQVPSETFNSRFTASGDISLATGDFGTYVYLTPA